MQRKIGQIWTAVPAAQQISLKPNRLLAPWIRNEAGGKRLGSWQARCWRGDDPETHEPGAGIVTDRQDLGGSGACATELGIAGGGRFPFPMPLSSRRACRDD